MTPSQIVWSAHGSPLGECGPGEGRCFVCCGQVEHGRLVADWLSTNFTDSNRCRMPNATHVCAACVFVQSRVSPVLGRPAGGCKVCSGTGIVTTIPPKGKGSKSKIGDPCPKCDGEGAAQFGGNFRNYSHLWEQGWASPAFAADETGELRGPPGIGYVNASKGEKPLVRAFLEREHAAPWFAAIADSGQKHVLPFARMNGQGRSGVVLFDEWLVSVPEDTSLIGEMVTMLTSGVTKDELASRDYYARSWQESRVQIEQFEARHGGGRGGGWFTLALWLAQRDEEEHARRQAEKDARNADRGNADRAKKRLPTRAGRKAADDVLDAAPGPSPKRGAAVNERERVVEPDAATAPDRKPRQGQLSFFD